MKIKFLILFLLSAFLSFGQQEAPFPDGIETGHIMPPTTNGPVGVNTTTPQGALDVKSTTKGMLIPRMTTTQKNAISSPVTSMLVFDTTLGAFSFYNGSAWAPLGGVDQNNIVRVKRFNFNGTRTNTALAAAVNSLPGFTIADNEVYLFVTSQTVLDAAVVPAVYKFFIKNIGKGNYGTGGTAVTASQIEMVYQSPISADTAEQLASTDVFDLGDTSGNTALDWVNLQSPPNVFQNQDDGYTLIKVIELGIHRTYLFTGPGGTYGDGADQVAEGELQLLSDFDDPAIYHPGFDDVLTTNNVSPNGSFLFGDFSDSYFFGSKNGIDIGSLGGVNSASITPGVAYVGENGKYSGVKGSQGLILQQSDNGNYTTNYRNTNVNNDGIIIEAPDVAPGSYTPIYKINGLYTANDQGEVTIPGGGGGVSGLTDSGIAVVSDNGDGTWDVNVPVQVENNLTASTTVAPSKTAVNTALALKADLASPGFTGAPTAPTAANGTNTTQLATTAFVQTAANAKVEDNLTASTTVAPSKTAVNTALALKAPLASPALTGVPTAPTASAGTNSTQIATTANVVATANAKVEDNLTASTTVAPSKTAVNTALALKSDLASPTFTGTPAAPTATAGTNTTQIATTAFVTAANALKADIASPTFTGSVTIPSAGFSLSGGGSSFLVQGDGVQLSKANFISNQPTNVITNSIARIVTGNTVITIGGRAQGQLDALSSYVAKTAAYTATEADYMIDCTTGTFTVNLPTTFTASSNAKQFVVKNSGTGTITVTTAGGTVTFDGATSKTLNTQYSGIRVIWDGSNYKIIGTF